MDYQALQEDVKSDLKTIPTLKMGILSAGDLYGSLAAFVLKLSLILLCINLAIQMGLHAIGFYYAPLSTWAVFACWGLTFVGSGFIMIFLSNFILFGKLVKGRLKTEGFIKQKCQQFSLLYLLIYSIAYFVLITGLDAFGGANARDREFFGLISTVLTLGGSQLGALIGSLIMTGILANIEISRLGMGIAFDLINSFMARVNNHPITEEKLQDGSDA